MPHDYEVARKVWEAHVPVEIKLEQDGGDAIRPFYMMMPRCSYFGLHLHRVTQYFANYDDIAPLDPANLVLECNGQVIKTYIPIGVLYDLYKGAGGDIFQLAMRNKKPEETGIVQRDVLKSIFLQAIKEADYLKRKGDLMSSMSPAEHEHLWNGVNHYKFDEFWSTNKRLMEYTEGKPFQHCPIRFYEQGKPFKQQPLKPLTTAGEPVTLKEALSQIYPDTDLSERQIVSHGIGLPLDTPITYLAESLSYPDNFVHVVIA